MSSKTDFECLMDIMMNMVKNLNDDQYEKLLKGEAKLEYVTVDNRAMYEQLFLELMNQESADKKLKFLRSKKTNLSTKDKLHEFCKVNKIVASSKDTKDKLLMTIINVTEGENIQASDTLIIELANNLKNATTTEEAQQLFETSSLNQTKDNLLKLAKELNVHVSKKLKKADLIDKIVKSVVQLKIDSEIILRRG